MDVLSNSLQNIKGQSDKYIYCPSGICANIPEIHYSSNPLKTEFQFKCNCQNNNNINIMNLEEFLEKSTRLKCFICKRKLLDDEMIYCIECKKIVDNPCLEYHHKNTNHSHYLQLNKNIFNYCLEHKFQYIFRCMDCNQSLCEKCNFSSHDNNGHELEQIKKFALKQNVLDKIKSNFEKQKKYFERIKVINNNMMKTLENDIEIKERIINSVILNKLDYTSILNMNNICIQNNEKYEKLLDDIFIEKEGKTQNESNNKECDDYIDNYLSVLYYSLMINKEKAMNDSLINVLEKKVSSLIPPLINPNNNSENINKQFLKENINNYNTLSNSKNNLSTSIISNQIYNSDIHSINNFNQYPQIDFLTDAKTFNKYKLMYPQLKIDDKNNSFNCVHNNQNQMIDSNDNNYTNYNQSIVNNINNLRTPINKSNYNSNKSSKSNGKNNKQKNSTNSSPQTSSEKNIGNKNSKKMKKPNLI